MIPAQPFLNARKILHFLSYKKKQLSPLMILTHDYPDPDAIASALALDYLCRHFGIESRIAYSGVIGRMENRVMVKLLRIPIHKFRTADLKKYSKFALMDTQPCFSNNSFPGNRKAAIVIDQHPSVKKAEADLVIIDTDCGATSVVLAQTLLQSRLPIPPNVATALAYGILSDTLNLYRAVRPDVIPTYLRILPLCDLKILAHIQNPSRSKSFFKTLGQGIQNAFSRRGLIMTRLGIVENPDLVAQVADFLLTYKNTQRSFCMGRYKGKLHVSLRLTSPNVEASDVLRDIFINRGEAGGHDRIAGGSFYVGEKASEAVWQEAERGMIERLCKRLRIPAKGDVYYPFK